MTDETGSKVSQTEYQPYGKVSEQTGDDVTPYKFTGKELDTTGLYYYGARYYDPEIGRFITPDSIVQSPYDPQTLNRYTYCRNNPLKYVDPSGHFFGLIIAAIIGAVIGGAVAAATGGDIVKGLVFGAISGALFAGFGQIAQNLVRMATVPGGIGPMTAGANMTSKVLGGVLGGAASAGVSGGNVGMGALGGGLGTGLGGFGILGAAVAGGIMSEAQGGSFGQGAAQGATYAGIAAGVNFSLNKFNRSAPKSDNSTESAIKQAAIDGDVQRAVDIGQAEGGAQGIIKGAGEAAKQNANTDVIELPAIEVLGPAANTQSKGINWKTVGIGLGTTAAGALTIAGSLAAGSAATAATGGAGFSPAVIYAGNGVIAGITIFAIGVGDIGVGLTGGQSILLPALRAIYGMPPEATAVNPF